MSLNKRFITVEELAEMLQVPRSWVYDRTYCGKIPHVKLGKLLRFDEQKILEWLEEKERGNGQ